MSDVDERLDEILVDSVGMDFCENDECTHYKHYLDVKKAIKQLMADEFEKMIGELEYRETFDMNLSSWTTEDIKAFGKNELKNELRQKLIKWRK